ncbi:hypothetical protein [Cyanobium sp. ATX 6F1]|uniref:hypothetical protein n=1 Tax=Cyanobium sp. ATX 6F1 TaxID=2823702 RepID=UPI0020CCDA11|nr:hypothetical protein [Cyanobium sp. ATX 6F1]MCP9915991.1 hypothetical protein [Cyanobium sp. ATX 6F1]
MPSPHPGQRQGHGRDNQHIAATPLMTIALLIALAGSLVLMGFIVRRLERG